MDRSRSTFVLFVGYVWVVTLAGLALHPYKSVKGIVIEREKHVLLPVVLSPLYGLLGLFVAGRVGSYIFELGGRGREIVSLVLGSTLIGLLLWQALILGLVYRFYRGMVWER